MTLGETLLALRKKAGLSQEEVAAELEVSRQTVSKWETDQTVPELAKTAKLSRLFGVSSDYLIGGGAAGIDPTDRESLTDEIDWSRAWSGKYPILTQWPEIEGTAPYRERISNLCDEFRAEFALSRQDAFLVLKDMLYRKYREDIAIEKSAGEGTGKMVR